MSIESMATIYKKGYETLCDSFDAVIGLYNICNKGTYDNFDKGVFDFREKLSKFGSKYNKYVFYSEKSDSLFDVFKGKINNTIRNAEGHNSIKIDGLNQNVTFVSVNSKGKIHSLTESFLEFGKQCIELHSALLFVWEYYYQLFKIKLVRIEKMTLNYKPVS